MIRVLAHGVFDLLHSGHVKHLQQVKNLGDHVTVSVVSDKFVRKPFLLNDQATRMLMVGALKYVDAVVLCDDIGPSEILRTLRPDIYVRNDEYWGQTKPEYEVCKNLGISVLFTKTYPPHTADIIKKIKAL